MITMQFKNVQSLFLDRERFNRETSRAEQRAMGRIGTIIRRKARDSMRRKAKLQTRRVLLDDGTYKTVRRLVGSKPGEPPRQRTGELRDRIFYIYDPRRRSVVVGPTASRSASSAPRALEYGGPTTDYVYVNGERKLQDVTIEARPFMGPAFEAKRSELPLAWQGTFGRGQ